MSHDYYDLLGPLKFTERTASVRSYEDAHDAVMALAGFEKEAFLGAAAKRIGNSFGSLFKGTGQAVKNWRTGSRTMAAQRNVAGQHAQNVGQLDSTLKSQGVLSPQGRAAFDTERATEIAGQDAANQALSMTRQRRNAAGWQHAKDVAPAVGVLGTGAAGVGLYGSSRHNAGQRQGRLEQVRYTR